MNREIKMNILSEDLKKEYNREEKLLGDIVIYNNLIVTPKDVLKAHYIITDYFFHTEGEKVLFGIKNVDLLLSAVGGQMTTFMGKDKWKEPLEKCATLFYGLNKNHAFNDGNKRTSLLITLYNLYLIHRIPTGNQKKFETLTIRIAANELNKYKIYQKYANNKELSIQDINICVIAHELKRLTRKADMRFYALTYREFSQRLEQLNEGYHFGNPDKNFISIYQTKKNFFGKTQEVFIRQIGFPGWSKQIGEKAAKSVLHDLQLDDYFRFFKGGEPIYKLLDDYSAPLSRLKDE